MTDADTVLSIIDRSREKAAEVGATAVMVLMVGRDGIGYLTQFNLPTDCIEHFDADWHDMPAAAQ